MNIGQWVHFSIDDVIGSFQWIYRNKPQSIFDEPMLAQLKKWHEEYDIACDLYVFEHTDGFCLTDLQDTYCEELQKEAGWLKTTEPLNDDLEMDIRFDYFLDGMTVQDCFEQTQQFFHTKYKKGKIELFCHEWRFADIASKIDEYWKRFDELKMPLFMNASVEVGDKLYFTTCNTNTLYRLDLNSSELHQVTEIPCTTHNTMKFASLVAFEEKIWMIPCTEEKIYIYDMKKDSIIRVPLPYACEEGETIKFRKAIKTENYLWLLPFKTPIIVRVDMHAMKVKVYDCWPEEVAFPEERKMNFISMCISNNFLYLFKYDCNCNIRLDMKNDAMEICDLKISKEYAQVWNEQLWICPTYSGTSIRCYDIDSLKNERIEDVPPWVWADEEIYAFWNPQKVGDVLLFLPHEANAVMCMKGTEGKETCICIDNTDYVTLRKNKQFAGYDAMEVDDGVLITSYMGNKIIVIGSKGVVVKEYLLTDYLSKISPRKGTVCREYSGWDLNDFIDRIVHISDRMWNTEKG